MFTYEAGTVASPSTVDQNGVAQVHPLHYVRRAIIEASKLQYFTPLANPENMPRNYGKRMVFHQYIHILDDRNVNSMGIDATGAVSANGNLYGSSRDIGKITGQLPFLREEGGRVNRVGQKRIERSGEIYECGFFQEWTDDSMKFDSDPDLMKHLARELLEAAMQISEMQLAIDLVEAAGVVLYGGVATSMGTVTGEGANPSVIDEDLFDNLARILTDNRTPLQTKIITGSNYTDTAVLPAARVLYAGTNLVYELKRLRDSAGEKLFINLAEYKDASKDILNGEVGALKCGDFRVVQVPEMPMWAGAGALATAANLGYQTAVNAQGQTRYNVYPLLCVGEDSFCTIGFQTDGKSARVNVITKMPGKEIARPEDPFGKTGFSSISWFYGFVCKRPERIGVIKVVAKY